MGKPKKKAPTILDVATAAGVTKSTVSRALSGAEDVSASTRAHVQRTAEQLGYVANAMAKGLRDEHSRTLGVVMHDVTDPFAGYLHAAMQAHAQEVGYTVVTATGTGELTLENAQTPLQTLVSLQVAGILLCSPRFDSRRVIPYVDRVPVVTAGRDESDHRIFSVCCDDADGGAVMAEHIIGLGHRDVAVILIDAAYSPSQHARGMAMIETLLAAGVRGRIFRVPTNAAAVTALDAILDARPPITAVMCPNDRTQVAIMEECERRGVDVPGRLSVTGFDGIGPLATSSLGLTTFRQPIEEIGRAAVDLMLAAIDERSPADHLTFRGHLVPGRTAGPPR